MDHSGHDRFCLRRESVAGTAGSIVRWTGDYSAGSAVLPLLAQTGAPSFHGEGSNVIETHVSQIRVLGSFTDYSEPFAVRAYSALAVRSLSGFTLPALSGLL